LKKIILILTLFHLTTKSFCQNNSTSDWGSFLTEKKYSWFESNSFKTAQILDIKFDTLNGFIDTTILWTIELDPNLKLLTKVYYSDVKNNKPFPKKFNAYYLFDSLGYPYQVDEKLRTIQQNDYLFDSNGQLVKENQWSYTYNSEGQLTKAVSDSLPCCKPNSKIEYYYQDNQLVKSIRTNYTMHRGPFSTEERIYKENEIIITITYLDSGLTEKQTVELEPNGINTSYFSPTGKLFKKLKIKYIN